MSYKVDNDEGILKVEKVLENNAYLGGDFPNANDSTVFFATKKIPN